MATFPDSRRAKCDDVAGRVAKAIDKLQSLQAGEAGLIDVMDLGQDAVPALRNLLFRREPSGIHQPRCRAIEALAALRAFEPIGEFLRSAQEATDPVERLGDDAVRSSAGRALARLRERWVYDLLFDAARRRPLQGVLFGLGSFRSDESIPLFVAALSEDELRLTAQAILRTYGKRAAKPLAAAAVERECHGDSESDLRKRRSALAILLDLNLTGRAWSDLQGLLDDRDRQVSLLACELCSKIGSNESRKRLKTRLVELRADAEWHEREQIDNLLKSIGRR